MSIPIVVIFILIRKKCPANNQGYASHESILKPIAENLKIERENYPMTIVYMKLKYCGYAFKLFSSIILNPFSNNENIPEARLYAQFHAPATKQMKADIIKEVKHQNSRVCVIFATAALGMGVDAPYVNTIIHISPPSSIETYIQEVGRAGRTGMSARAILYYNNSDIATNKNNVDDKMKYYCYELEKCLRQVLMGYFGFSVVQQSRCCSNCEKFPDREADKVPIQKKIRLLDGLKLEQLRKEVENIIFEMKLKHAECMEYCQAVDIGIVNDIVENVEFISCENDLLFRYGIWNEDSSSQLFSVICKYAPQINS